MKSRETHTHTQGLGRCRSSARSISISASSAPRLLRGSRGQSVTGGVRRRDTLCLYHRGTGKDSKRPAVISPPKTPLTLFLLPLLPARDIKLREHPAINSFFSISTFCVVVSSLCLLDIHLTSTQGTTKQSVGALRAGRGELSSP